MEKKYQRMKVLMMITGAFAIFFTGCVHVWSIYQPYIMEQTGWSQNQAAMCFYLASCIFVFGNIFGGKMQDKMGPKPVVFWGGAMFTAGVIASSFLIIQTPIPMYFTYGAMQGFGQGMIYSAVLATAQKWFPGRTGFASGIVVTSNGLCAFFLAPVSRFLLERYEPGFALFIMGIVIAVSWVLSSIFVIAPKPEWLMSTEVEKNGNAVQMGKKQYTSGEMIQTKMFYYMVLTMLCGLIPYYLLSPISQTLQIEQGVAATVAVGSVMCGSILNAATRLVLPSLADKLGRIRCIRVVLYMVLTAMLVLTFFEGYATTAAVVLMYICFGGVMGNFPALTSSVFGLEHAGENYGYIMIGLIVASMGSPVISGAIEQLGMNQQAVFGFGAICACMALLFITCLKKEIQRVQQ